MAKLVDPEKLISVAQLAEKYDLDRTHISRAAAQKKFEVWYIGKTWVTTEEIFCAYLKSRRRRGRPKKSDTNKKS